MRHIARTTAIVLILSFAAAVCHAADSPWPMFRHDRQHTARTPFTGPAAPVVSWSYPTDQGIASSPTIGPDGTIYVGIGWYYAFTAFADTCLLALRPDGSLKWRFCTQKGIFSSPTLGPDGTIYISSLGGYLYALEDSLTYAKPQWRTYLEYFFLLSSPALGDDGTIYVGSPSFYFYAVDPDGSIDWKYQTGWCIISSPAIGDDGTVYIGSKDHNLYAFDPAQKNMLWAAPTGVFYDGHLVDSSPAIGEDGTIYVGSDQFGAQGQKPVAIDTSFWAFNPDGSRKWVFPTGSGVESSPAIGPDGTIYFGSYDGNLYAVIDAGNEGILQWKFPTGGAVDGSPTVDGDGTIYFGSRDSTLYALHPDGSVKWTYRADGGFESSPTIDGNGMLYIGCFDGKLYAFGTGAPDVGVATVGIPPVVQPDSLYVPRATVKNYRASTLSFSAACLIERDGIAVYADTVAVSALPGGDSLQLEFAPWTVIGAEGEEFMVTAVSILSGDDNTYNDTQSATAEVSAGPSGILGDEQQAAPPRLFSLAQNYPNPFNPETRIEFALLQPGFVTLNVYDLRGSLVRELVSARYPAGRGSVVWDGKNSDNQPEASGIYFYRLQTGDFSETRKMVLLK